MGCSNVLDYVAYWSVGVWIELMLMAKEKELEAFCNEAEVGKCEEEEEEEEDEMVRCSVLDDRDSGLQ